MSSFPSPPSPFARRASQRHPRGVRSWLPLAAALAIALASPNAARAQADEDCPSSPRPTFAGHAFELDATLEATDLSVVDGYPDLDHGIQRVTAAVNADDDSDRIFLVEQTGTVWVFDDDPEATEVEAFLDVTTLVAGANEGESGLLGLAFDPDFGNAASPRFGEFYVYMSVANANCACEADDSCELSAGSTRDHCSNVVRFRATAEEGPYPDTVDPLDEGELILEIEQPRANHNGGTLVFGPDDLLYISSGDGGLSNDNNQAQHDDSLLGKILRIDPRGRSTYVIPSGNPFFDEAGKAQEILHLGLRNPWKISFDRETGDLWIGDVGAGDWEEIDYVASGSEVPMNFGWPECEGIHEVGQTAECDFEHERPVLELDRGSGGAITGGYVYRGTAFPELHGRYVFAELVSRRIYAWDRTTVDEGTGLGVPEILDTFGQLATLGETEAGELLFPQYKSSGSSTIGRFEGTGASGAGIPLLLSQTGLFVDTAADRLVASPGLIEYEIANPLWSDAASKRRWFGLPGSQKIGFRSEGAWTFPVGTVLVKHFELPHDELGSQRVETRVLLNQEDDWLGFTYRWNAAQSQANLLKVELVEEICLDDACSDRQTWTYPSPTTCLSCHTDAATRVLGLRAEQFNRPVEDENQLRSLNCMEVFDNDIGVPAQYRAFATIEDETAGVHERVRSYLASNCAHCHRPDNVVQADIDLRFTTPLSETGLVGEMPIHDIPDLVDPSLLEPGDASQSVLWHRQHVLDTSLRMAKLTRLRDDAAVDLQEDWIEDTVVNMADDDHDGEDDPSDNCPQTFNPDQDDFDSDDEGDACDPDTRPDLIAEPPMPDHDEVPMGARIAVQAEVTNEGDGPARASQLRFFISQDGFHDPEEDPWIGDCFVGNLDPSERDDCRDAGARIPNDLAPIERGETVERYLGVCSDALDLVAEGNESNNCTVSRAVIVVPEPRRDLLRLTALLCLAALRWRRAFVALAVLLGFALPFSTASAQSLRFYGHGGSPGDGFVFPDRVKIDRTPPAAVNAGAADFTVEFWMKASAADNPNTAPCGVGNDWVNSNIIIDADRFNQPRAWGIGVLNSTIVFGVLDDFTSYSLCGTTNPTDGAWHHVAVERRASDGRMRIYLDGVLDGEGPVSGGPGGDLRYPVGAVPGNYCSPDGGSGGQACTNSDPFLVFGAEKHGFPGINYNGLLTEVRLSNTLRYTGSFSVPTAPFVSDVDTAALYHFDEGGGTSVADASLQGGDGTIFFGGSAPAGPVWSADSPFSTGVPSGSVASRSVLVALLLAGALRLRKANNP